VLAAPKAERVTVLDAPKAERVYSAGLASTPVVQCQGRILIGCPYVPVCCFGAQDKSGILQKGTT